MNTDQIRNKLAPLTRGQSIEIKSANLKISIDFNESGNFSICTQEGSAASCYATESLAAAVDYIYKLLTPKVGQVYQHINSNVYTIWAIANEHSQRPDYPPSVVYQGVNGLVWVKPLTKFLAKMTRIK